MKKILILTAIIGVITVCTTSVNAVVVENTKGQVSVNTTSEADVAPDVAEISFAVKTTDNKSMQKATTANKEASDKIYAILKSMINPAAGDYIKTSDFNATPIYSYNNSKKIFERYEVTNRVTVHTKSINKIGEMIDKSITSGATNVDSLNFSLSNYDAKCDELIARAGRKAYDRANLLAKSLNTSITGISNISTSCGSNGGNRLPRLYMAKNMVASVAEDSAAQGSGMAISDGVIKLTANVNASFFVK